MKSGKINLLLITAFLITITSCERWRCIKGNDNRITETREVGNFLGVVTEGEYEVYIIVDTSLDSPEVVITADENLFTYIITEVSGQDLIISNYDNRCLKSDRPIMITITAPDIDYVELSGSGSISCENVNREKFEVNLTGSGIIKAYEIYVDYINVNHTGSGEIELHGSALEADYTLDGSGRINAYHMELNKCYVTLEGSGDVIVWAWDYLYVDLPGSGIVYYRIRPLEIDCDDNLEQIMPF